MLKTLASKFPSWLIFATGVRYIDPLNCFKDNVEILTTKHFRFSYQKEYRVACCPVKPKEKLEQIFINIGNLEDICELISLE